MSKDEIQTWMLVAFIISLFFSFYKIYLMFNKPGVGKNTKVQYKELEEIVTKFFKTVKDSKTDDKTLFEALIKEDTVLHVDYQNFNLNRFNQIIRQMYFTYDVDSLPELIQKIKKD